MLKYEIALINVFWGSNGIDSRYHKSVEDQQSYFLEKANGKFSPVSNFPMGNNISTNIIVQVDKVEDIEQAVASNYAVVRRNIYNENNELIEQSYRYYFAFCSQDSGRQLFVQLELDDIQTNYFKYKELLPQANIRRAHLDRWDKDNNGNFIFKTQVNSPFFLTELVNEPIKKLITREKVNLKPIREFENFQYSDFYNNNIIGWLYVYLSNGEYQTGYAGQVGVKLVDYQIENIKNNIYYDSPFDGGVSLLCVPLYQNEPIKMLYEGVALNFNLKSIEKFR